ncbi:cupin domain-containing protein [Thalassotalea sp. Y01]|uniref:cupin domain-containing protein n=1 Tax=Thalassotalea sp. Y01 TaxID=2729613 RepID=UPI00145F273B|nr:cupin domain-containing protein [Thalassotalea sp. Y01]NMP17439.1 cupin domain-containing protein [Thalassotalea sp. Y01]
MKRVSTIIAMLSVILSFVANATDLKKQKEILLDNEKVEVIRLTYPPHSESGMHNHQHPNRTVYVLAGGELTLINHDGKTQVLQVATGSVLYLPAMQHNVKNSGATTVILIETELKAR